MKKFLVLFIIFGMFTMMVPNAKASTIDDLYAQIKTLQKQVATLQSQLTGLALRTVAPVDSLSTASKVVAPTAVVAPTPTPVPAPVLPTTKIVTPTPVSNVFPTVVAPTKVVVPTVTTKDTLPVATKTNTTTLAPITDVVNKMTIGSKGNDVLALQKILIKKGFLKVDSATGNYGTTTAAAVSSFQKANGLGVDGVAGKGTIKLLNSQAAASVPCSVTTLSDIYGNTTTVVTPSVTVLSPNGGEVYQPGQQITVNWSSCGIPATNNNVSVLLRGYSNGVAVTDMGLVVNTTNSGQATVTLPSTSTISASGVSLGTNFKISVATSLVVNGPTIGDYSDNLFTIGANTQTPSITVTSPNGGEIYQPGQQITVTWTSVGIPATSTIDLSLDTVPGMGGTIGLGDFVNNGTGVVTLPIVSTFPGMVYGNNFKIRAYIVPNTSLTDSSDNMFTIGAPTTSASWTNVGIPGFFTGSALQYPTTQSFALDSNNTPYVVFSDQADSYLIKIKKFNGTSWVDVGVPNSSFSGFLSLNKSIVIDSNNIPYVAYSDAVNNYKATVKKFNGTSWVNVGNPGFSVGVMPNDGVAIAIDSNNIPYVAYSDGSNGGPVTVKKFNGTSWMNVGNPNFSVGNTQYVSLSLDSNNIPYVAYSDTANSGKLTVMKFNGTSWASVGTPGFSDGNGVYFGPISLVFDLMNVPFISYDPVVPFAGQQGGVIMKFNGTSWVSAGALTSPGYTEHHPVISFDSNNNLYVACFDLGSTTPNLSKVVVKEFNGISFVDMSPNLLHSQMYNLSIVLGSNNTPYISYFDMTNGNKVVFMKYQ